MRRPTFKRWIRRRCCALARVDKFSFMTLMALAQSPAKKRDGIDRTSLAAALHLHALSNNCIPHLREYTFSDELREKQARVESALGARDIERLALRGTPLLTLPVEYREILQAFYDNYHLPEKVAQEKLALQEQARDMQVRYAVFSIDIANATGIAAPNVVAFLKHADVGRVTLDGAESIVNYLKTRVPR